MVAAINDIPRPTPDAPITLDQSSALASLRRRECLDRYLTMALDYGVAVQPDQVLAIAFEPSHHDLALRLARLAQGKAKKVVFQPIFPELKKAELEGGSLESLAFVPDYERQTWEWLVKNNAARIYLFGEENPHLLEGQDPAKVSMQRRASEAARKVFRDEGIGQSKMHWLTLPVVTKGWACQVFPGLPAEAAVDALWDVLFKICRVDSPNWQQRWHTHTQLLQQRCKFLNDLGVDFLHFQGPGTNLRVKLLSHSVWKGGPDTSVLGKQFVPNIPTEEVFTSPLRTGTDGVVRATRPLVVNETRVDDLVLTFRAGRIVNCTASKGLDSFLAHIETDYGARFIGEIALVGNDSPIAGLDLDLEMDLIEENRYPHLALGDGFTFCVKDAPKLETFGPFERLAIGLNYSLIHSDTVIGGQEVDCTAITHSGRIVPLLVRNDWAMEELKFLKPPN